MDISADVNAIVEQAPNWSLAKDLSILELMKRISQNLEMHAERTKNTVKEFECNVKHTEIALDNMANSLRSLCNQQFVEEIIEELDDNDFDVYDRKKRDSQPESPPKSSNEMMVEFVQNNLKMFRENFEAVTIDVPDSDDEDDVTPKTIYRAKNPYDAIPLPYIIGSKEWNVHKYAGLYDSSNDSEELEEFSSSSSDENEVLPKIHQEPLEKKKTETTLSDSSSFSSIHIEPASAHRPLFDATASMTASQSTSEINIQPKTQPRQIISSARTPHDHDLFATLRQSPPSDDPPSTSSSTRASPLVTKRTAQHKPPVRSSLSSSSSSASKPNLGGRQLPPKLFDEAVTVSPSLSSSISMSKEFETVSAKPIPANQIKRKPVNLFNDDDFDSFMAEIADKVQAKTEKSSIQAQSVSQNVESAPTILKQNPQPKNNAFAPKKLPDPPRQTVNLFDDSPPLSPPMQSKPSITPKKSIFDDNLDSEDFLSSIKSKVTSQKMEQKAKLSLFDDDDDFDIEDIFGKKNEKKETSDAFVKASASDDEKGHLNEAKKTVTSIRKDALNEQTLSRQKPIESIVAVNVDRHIQPMIKSKSLFDDMDDDDLFSFVNPKQEASSRRSDETTNQEIKRSPAAASDSVQDLPPNQKNLSDYAKESVKNDELLSVLAKDSAYSLSDVTESAQIEPTEVLIQSIGEPSVVDLDTASVADVVKISDIKPTIGIFNQIYKQENSNNSNIPNQVQPFTTPSLEEEIAKESNKQQSEQSNKAEKDDGNDLVRDDIFTKASATPIVPYTNTISTKKEDPIISMVADITGGKSNSNTPRKVADVAAAQQIMQNYTSLFSDEPPDDSEFFQNLSSSGLSSLSASKIFDAEQDFFEPSLPDIPGASKAAASTSSDQQGSSDYGRVQLFSDVPPDDVDQPENNMDKGSDALGTATATRIHTIFYDDFSETTRASTAEAAKPSNFPIEVSFFDDEPPPDMLPPTIKEADAVNRDSPKIKEQILPPINKLKMPNININVKALLPGSGVMPKLKSQDSIHDENDGNVSSTAPSSNARIIETTPRTDNENILQSVNKSRARGPAHRRPSTRRGRHENYEKALLAETESKLAELAKQQQPVTIPSKPPTVPASKVSFSDSDNDDEFFGTVNSLPREPPADNVKTAGSIRVMSRSPLQTKPPADNVKATGAIPKVPKIATAKLFVDSDNDADDLFTSITQPKSKPNTRGIANPSGVVASNAAAGKSYLFSSDEDNSMGNGDFLRTLKQSTHKPKKAQSAGKSLFSDDDDDDDLFGGSRTKQLKQPTGEAQPSRHRNLRRSSQNTTKTVMPSENPLADLLDS